MAFGDEFLENDGFYPNFPTVKRLRLSGVTSPDVFTPRYYYALMSLLGQVVVDACKQNPELGTVEIDEDGDECLSMHMHVFPVLEKGSFDHE